MKQRSPLGQAFAQLTNLRIAEREPKMAVRELVSNFRNRAYVTITVLADETKTIREVRTGWRVGMTAGLGARLASRSKAAAEPFPD